MGYTGAMTELPSTAVMPEHVKALADAFPPGAVVPAVKLHARYAQMMEAQGFQVPHPTMLGHALRRADWIRKRVRKSVDGRIQERACWVIPGTAGPSEQDGQVYDALQSLGGGIHPNALIWSRYTAMAREQGWRDTLAEKDLARWLTRKGFIRMRDKGKDCRFVDPTRVAARA